MFDNIFSFSTTLAIGLLAQESKMTCARLVERYVATNPYNS